MDLPELVAEVVDPYRTGLAGRVEIHNAVRGPLPRVIVDRTLIARALSNIVENALHAMPGPGEISLHAAVEPGTVVMRVRDTGLGFPEPVLRGTMRNEEGKPRKRGWGLTLIRRLVDEVEIESGTHGTVVVMRKKI